MAATPAPKAEIPHGDDGKVAARAPLQALPPRAEPDAFRDRMLQLLAPWRALTGPLFLGLENIPEDRPLLFVGNHTIYGLFDSALLIDRIYRDKGILLRGMGDHVHFQIPLWRDFLARFGVVHGTRENCDALMRQGQAVLVFPGGAREVARRKNEKYVLHWKERMGFARQAIAHGCTIVPFSCIGMDDAWDVVLDAEDVMRSKWGPLVDKLGIRKEAILPVVKGLGRTPLPRPERVYFKFQAPIRTRDVAGRQADDAIVRDIRNATRDAVQAGIDELLQVRASDVERPLHQRALRKIFG